QVVEHGGRRVEPGDLDDALGAQISDDVAHRRNARAGHRNCPLGQVPAGRALLRVDIVEWQGGRVLDLFHREAGADVEQLRGLDQALVHDVIAADVGHHDAQQIIDVAAHPVELHDFVNVADRLGELLQPGAVVLV